LLPVLLAFLIPTGWGAEPTPSGDGKPQPMEIPIPVGEPVSGIKIPQYDESGKLSMTLLAGKARKLDDRKVEFEKLKVSFTDKEGKEIIVEIPHALLDTETRKLTSDSRTMVTRDDFDIAGDQAEFDTATRTGRFMGRVRASFRRPETPATSPL
jgi:lipopolysaccharide export system protein LptC